MKRNVSNAVKNRIAKIRKVTTMLQFGVIGAAGLVQMIFKKAMASRILAMEELSHLAWAPERLDYLSTTQFVGSAFILGMAFLAIVRLSDRKENLVKKALKA